MLLEDGYTHLSMRPLASAIGCTATSIYLYFKNKDALIHALIDEGFELLAKRFEAALKKAGDDPEERMRAIAGAYFDFGLSNSEYYEVMMMLHPKHMERYPAELYRKARTNLDLFTRQIAAVEGCLLNEKGLKAAGSQAWATMHGIVSLLIAQRIDIKVSRKELKKLAVDQAVSFITAAQPSS